jgi:hypothetical protein
MEIIKTNAHLLKNAVSGSYYALLDEDGNIVQLCKTEKGAKNAFYKFKTKYYNTGFYIENIIVD